MSGVRVNEERKKQEKISIFNKTREYRVQAVSLWIHRCVELNTQVQKAKESLFVTAPSENSHPSLT